MSLSLMVGTTVATYFCLKRDLASVINNKLYQISFNMVTHIFLNKAVLMVLQGLPTLHGKSSVIAKGDPRPHPDHENHKSSIQCLTIIGPPEKRHSNDVSLGPMMAHFY